MEKIEIYHGIKNGLLVEAYSSNTNHKVDTEKVLELFGIRIPQCENWGIKIELFDIDRINKENI